MTKLTTTFGAIAFLFLTAQANAKTCKIEQVDTPTKFYEVIEKQYLRIEVAFKTPSCKIVVFGSPSAWLAEEGHYFLMARFTSEGEFDSTFHENGRLKYLHDFNFYPRHLGTSGTVPPTVHTFEDKVALIWPSHFRGHTAYGMGMAIMNQEGELQQEYFQKGVGFSSAWEMSSNMSWQCGAERWTHLDVKNIIISGDKVSVSTVFNYCKPAGTKDLELTAVFNLVRPSIETNVPIPDSCAPYQFSSYGADNGWTHKITPNGCGFLRWAWDRYTSPGNGDYEIMDIVPDGRCFQSKWYGFTCFSYDAGFLKRTYIEERSWLVKHRYYNIVKTGDVCGYSNSSGLNLIESKYHPTHEKFLKDCRSWWGGEGRQTLRSRL